MKYQKRPVQIEAVQYNKRKYELVLLDDINYKDYFSETPAWLKQAIENETIYSTPYTFKAKIKTMEGDMAIKNGSYIIRGVQGEVYACDEDIFHETYEEV